MNGLIDPQPFIDDDGRVYMIVGSFHGNYIVELEDDGMSLLHGKDYQKENKVLIAGIPLDYFNNTYYEGGYITKKDGYYYLLIAVKKLWFSSYFVLYYVLVNYIPRFSAHSSKIAISSAIWS